jgi:hypothetical protein
MTLREKIRQKNKGLAENAAREARSLHGLSKQLEMGEYEIRPTDVAEKEENKVVAGYDAPLPDKGQEWLDERERNKRFADSVKTKLKKKEK